MLKSTEKRFYKIRKYIIFYILSALLFLLLIPIYSSAYSQNGITIRVNTESGSSLVPVNDDLGYPFIDESLRTLCPLRTVGQALGMEAAWDGNTRVASFTMDQTESTIYGDKFRIVETISFKIGSSDLVRVTKKYTNDVLQDNVITEIITMDTAPKIVNGRTYAPVRYLAESLGYSVDWQSYNRTVSVNATDNWLKKRLIDEGYKEVEIGNINSEVEQGKDETNVDENETNEILIAQPMELRVNSNVPTSTYDKSVLIEGEIDNCVETAILSCNEKAVKYNADGSFCVSVDLEYGNNSIVLKLYDNRDVVAIKSYMIKQIVDYYYEMNDTGVTITSYNGSELDVVIPSQIDGFDVTAIAGESFAFKNISSVVVPETVTEIGQRPFWNCNKLKSVVIKGSYLNLKSSGESMFSTCESLESVVFTGDNIKLTGAIFWHNDNLKNIEFSGENCELGSESVMYCNNLENVVFSGDHFNLGYGVFYRSSIENLILSGSNGLYSRYVLDHTSCDNMIVSDSCMEV